MKTYFLDTETCGFHGMPVLIQYAIDDGPIVLYEPWKEPVGKTIELLDEISDNCFVGFNNAFDWFHLCKLRTIWSLLLPDVIPEQKIHHIARIEPNGRDQGCFKPKSAFDIFLHTRKGPYQCLMARSPIRIKKVPTALARVLADELEHRIKFDQLLFARRKDKDAPKWKVMDRFKDGVFDPEFKDVMLNFHPAGGLKFLAESLLDMKPDFHFSDIELDKQYRPYELGYAPFALSVSTDDRDEHDALTLKLGYEYEESWWPWKAVGQDKCTWPGVISRHIEHWHSNMPARKYAEMDVEYTRGLYEYFDRPAIDDDDSILSCMVAAVRWHGFKIDNNAMSRLCDKAKATVEAAPININKPTEVRAYLIDHLDDTEALIIGESTKKAHIEQLRDFVVEEDEICVKCLGTGCPRCEGTGELKAGPMPVAKRAAEILEIKEAIKEVELYKKLLLAGRFHASFKVIGTLSSRMSGGDGLNPQGIKHADYVRKVFPLAWEGMVLSGGDFDSFEVTIADAVFEDEKLRADLKAGKKIHALMAQSLYPGDSYQDILNSKGSDFDKYTRGKQAVFAMLYGGDANTIHEKLAIPENIAEDAFEDFQKKYPGIKKTREDTAKQFQALAQPGGIGTAVKWVEPSDYVETFLGFRRYFTLENMCCKALFDLARGMPKHWHNADIKVCRRDRLQTASGAVSSALYGASFAIQSANVRAAGNHLIQSPGAMITKALQVDLWGIQPHGFHDWNVALLNIHDEVMTVIKPEFIDEATERVRRTVDKYRKQIPLIGMTWVKQMDNWAEKKGGVGDNEVSL